MIGNLAGLTETLMTHTYALCVILSVHLDVMFTSPWIQDGANTLTSAGRGPAVLQGGTGTDVDSKASDPDPDNGSARLPFHFPPDAINPVYLYMTK